MCVSGNGGRAHNLARGRGPAELLHLFLDGLARVLRKLQALGGKERVSTWTEGGFGRRPRLARTSSRSWYLAMSASLSSFSKPSSFLICFSCSIRKYLRWLPLIFSSTCLLISCCTRTSSRSRLITISAFSSRSSKDTASNTCCTWYPSCELLAVAMLAAKSACAVEGAVRKAVRTGPPPPTGGVKRAATAAGATDQAVRVADVKPHVEAVDVLAKHGVHGDDLPHGGDQLVGVRLHRLALQVGRLLVQVLDAKLEGHGALHLVNSADAAVALHDELRGVVVLPDVEDGSEGAHCVHIVHGVDHVRGVHRLGAAGVGLLVPGGKGGGGVREARQLGRLRAHEPPLVGGKLRARRIPHCASA